MRLSIWSFMRMFEMWFLTVFGLMWSSAAMTALSLPFAISFNTSISRSESSARIWFAISGCVLVARTRCRTFAAMLGEISDSPSDAGDVARRIHAAHPRHVQVHDHDVRRELAHELDRLDPACGLRDDQDSLL